MKTMTIKAGLAAALAAAATIATPAIAADEGESISVRYNDLNLATAEGQAALERRIDNAARQVCRIDEVRVGTRIRSNAAQQCYEETLEALSRQLATITEQNRSAG